MFDKIKHAAFGGFGLPELFVIVLVAIIIYCFAMIVDAIRRPSNQYSIGNKYTWIAVMILSNPLICRFFGELIWTIGTFIFLISSVSYHIVIRRHKDFDRKLPVRNDSSKIYDKEF